MSAEGFAHVASGIESIVTAIALIVGGYWALFRFGIAREGYPHIQFTADVQFITFQDGWWIVELLALVENKGRVRHNIVEFQFDLYSLNEGDPVMLVQEFGQQVRFPNLVAKGSWLSRNSNYFFIEPGVTAKYSHIARVPANSKAVILHAWFSYPDGKHSHTAERTIACPPLLGTNDDTPNKPLQPMGAAQPNGQREPTGSDPRG